MEQADRCENFRLINILIIEDDTAIAEVIALALEMEGYRVISVESRDQAVPWLQQTKFECIVMDLYMPGMDAAEFLEHVRKLKPRPKVILISAADRVVLKAKSLQIDAWVGKPFELNELFKILPPRTAGKNG